MSKGVTKIQLAKSVCKGKKIELEDLKTAYAAIYGRKVGMNREVPRTIFHDLIDERIRQLDHEIVGFEQREIKLKHDGEQ